MSKTWLWIAAVVVTIVLILWIGAKWMVLPFISTKIAALIVGIVGAITGLFMRKGSKANPQ